MEPFHEKSRGVPTEREGFHLRVNLKFFSTYKDIAGIRETSLTIPDESTLQTLLEIILKRYPRFVPHAETMILAVNRDFAALGTKLREGDEIAVMPPVGGG